MVEFVFTSTVSLYDHCFFFRNRPLEESPHQSCRAFRGEVDSSIPRVSGECDGRLPPDAGYYLNLVIPRIEEVQDPGSSPGREEVGRRTLGGYGGFLLPIFYRARFREVRATIFWRFKNYH